MVRNYNFEKYFDCLLQIVPINIAALVLMTIYRFFFFFYFADFSSLSGLYGDVFRAFFLGFRFDLSVLAYINILPVLIFTVFLAVRDLKSFKIFAAVIKYYYLYIFSVLALLTIIDFGFFTYFNEHINLLIFEAFADDTRAIAATIITDWRFIPAFIVLVSIVFIFFKLVKNTDKRLLNKKNLIAAEYWNIYIKIVIVLIVPCLIFLAARGTVSMFPLGTFYTQISSNAFINKLSIGGAHAFTDAIQAKQEQSQNPLDIAQKFGIDKETINLSGFEKITPVNKEAEAIRPNVVFIVLESFGALPIIFNSADFDVLGELKKHFDEDTVFYNFLSAGSITIHALENTILNMPQRPLAMQITQSPAAYKQFPSAAALPYKTAGYLTKAIYGGSLNWRGIENFFKAQGFDRTYGEGDIKNEHRHEWGINDAQFFELLLRELNADPETPKFIYAMSTGTHPPYETPPDYVPLTINIPEDLKRMMPGEKKYGKKIFESYQFANREAAKFLQAIKNSALAKNTIVVITGDHNLREIAAAVDEELFKKYSVPMYIYAPEKLKKPFNTDIAACHMDIMPTLYDLSLSDTKYTAAGTSVLEKENHIAYNTDGFILSGDNAVLYNIHNNSCKTFKFDAKTKMLSKTEETKEHAEMIEYYKRNLAEADFYLKTSAAKKEKTQ
ncbi:MAG: sulfatase-like hydrolase/transferase [Endomicrobia bacterium]|nr:sulfatase-like hydrolase/transferase [Endomicrobiia bacterium]MCL2506703.1 sulfatase-like hydrolase/transferase [Endomicrobiia bacterium]